MKVLRIKINKNIDNIFKTILYVKIDKKIINTVELRNYFY